VSDDGSVTTVAVSAAGEVLALTVRPQEAGGGGGGGGGDGGGPVSSPPPPPVSVTAPASQAPQAAVRAVLESGAASFAARTASGGATAAAGVVSGAFSILATSTCQAVGAECGGSHTPQPVAFVVAVLGDSVLTLRRNGRGELTVSCPADLGPVTGRFAIVDPDTGRLLARGRFACTDLSRFLRVRFRLRPAALRRLQRTHVLSVLVHVRVDAAAFEVAGEDRRIELRLAPG
jgi:hypothetical protein